MCWVVWLSFIHGLLRVMNASGIGERATRAAITFDGSLKIFGPTQLFAVQVWFPQLTSSTPHNACFPVSSLPPLIFPQMISQAIVAAKAQNKLATGPCVECLKWLVQITMLEDGSEKKADLVHLFLCVILGALDTSVPVQVRQVRLQFMH